MAEGMMMNSRRGLSFLAVLYAALFLVAGCHRNPDTEKRKYSEKAAAFFQQGKYREAAIMYQNAIQIDPQFAEAHYGLSQCLMKQSDFTHAYQELMRTVELEPTNWKAQLDLGNLYLAAGKLSDARDRAETILKSDPQNAAAELLLANIDAAQGLERIEKLYGAGQ